VKDVYVHSWSASNQELFAESWTPAVVGDARTATWLLRQRLLYEGSDGLVTREHELGLSVSKLEDVDDSTPAPCTHMALVQRVDSPWQAGTLDGRHPTDALLASVSSPHRRRRMSADRQRTATGL